MRSACRFGASLLAVALLAAGPARAAELEVVPGSLSIRALDAAGEPERRAGAHPDRLRIEFAVNSEESGTALKDLAIELPPGLGGDPDAVAQCSRKVYDDPAVAFECPAASKIGEARVELTDSLTFTPAIFNVEPAPGELATFGFRLIPKFPFGMSIRRTDYGLRLEQGDSIQALSLKEVKIELWGVPADHQEGGTSLPRRSFLTLPTRCGEPLEATLRIRSWQPGATWNSATAKDELPLHGCESLPFAPNLAFGLTESQPDSLTGAQIDLGVPQSEDPDALASSHLKRATVTLPEGVTISPGALDGIETCSEDELRSDSSEPSTCPADSRIGTLELAAAQLREPLVGKVYLGEERPGDRFRVFAVARGTGIDAKLTGSLRVDPASGRLQVVLPDLP